MMSIFVLPIIIWWTYYLFRLYNHAHDEQFLKMPWLYLWAAAYNTGWCYTLIHFFVLENLDTSFFGFVEFPLASFLCASLYFLQIISVLRILFECGSATRLANKSLRTLSIWGSNSENRLARGRRRRI